MQNVSQSNYRNSLKSTLLFSFVQVYQIIIRIVRSKFVAMFIGPAGMGVMSLLHSTTDLISASTNLGLKTSGVKSVAAANATNDKEKIEKIIAVLRKLVFATGLVGMFICACLSPVWSKTSFGNADYTWSFVIVSVIILLDQLNSGELVMLQGMQKKKYLARANVIGQTIGLFIAIPLYYFFRVKAIVWVLVSSSLLTLLISKYYTNKIDIKRIKVSAKEVVSVGREMVKLGILLSIQFLFSQISMYVVRNYVSNTGSLDDVGLYSAGSTIINMYLGLVFTAIATDYFPRLAGTKTSEELCASVRQQAEVTILLFAPLIVAFVVYIKPVILLLYSEQFLPIEKMLYWAMGATLIKAMAWAMSYSVLAKAKTSVFFWNEVFSIGCTLLFNILGYHFWGLTGFGVSILVGYTVYLIQMMIVTRKSFGFSYGKKIWGLFLALNVFVVVSLVLKAITSPVLQYVLGSMLFVASAVYSLYELNKRMDLRNLFSRNKK